MVPTPKWVMDGCMGLDVRWGMMVMMKGEVLIPLGGGREVWGVCEGVVGGGV